jgi:hypothetical protein
MKETTPLTTALDELKIVFQQKLNMKIETIEHKNHARQSGLFNWLNNYFADNK